MNQLKPKIRELLFLVSCLGVLVHFSGCVTSTADLPEGLQKEHAGFVPARIAVLNCEPWPAELAFDDLPKSNVSDEQLKAACARFDKFVVQGFDEQPYMRGLTPDAVRAILKKSNKENTEENPLEALPQLWGKGGDLCAGCQNAGAFYEQSIANRPQWQSWLTQFSRSVRNADALLMPRLLFVREETANERGVIVASRRASIAMLLIDTNNGSLVWFGDREAVAAERVLSDALEGDKMNPPGWEVLYDRLFTNDVWRQFPGRQEN